jgi:hypothetical protein
VEAVSIPWEVSAGSGSLSDRLSLSLFGNMSEIVSSSGGSMLKELNLFKKLSLVVMLSFSNHRFTSIRRRAT